MRATAAAKQKKPNFAAEVDRLGEIMDKMEALRPLEREAAAIKAKLRAACADEPESEPVFIAGKSHIAMLSPVPERRRVDSEALYHLVGVRRFLALVSISAEKVATELPAHQHAKVIEAVREGSRVVSVAAALPR